MGSRGIRHFHQCQGALGNREGSFLVCSSNLRLLRSNFRRQRYGSSLSQESGRDTFVTSQFHRSEHSPLGGVASSPAVSSVHHGKTQCSGGFVVSSESGPGLRVDSEAGGISGAAQEVAGFHRPVRHLSKSPLFSIFFSLPRSERSGNGCSSQELVCVAGVCLSTLVAHSCGSEEAPVVLWGPADHHSSLLASEAVVPRSSGSGGGWSSGSASVQRPPSPTPLPSLSSGGVQTVASCLETIQRFARARGFSKRVAQQVALAHHPSSRAGYQAKWFIAGSVARKAIPFPGLLWLKSLISFFDSDIHVVCLCLR